MRLVLVDMSDFIQNYAEWIVWVKFHIVGYKCGRCSALWIVILYA